MLNGPIPGQSLTESPKNARWERPPEENDPEKVIQIHLANLQDPDRMQAALDMLEFTPMTLHELVQGIVRGGVSRGMHSIDTGLIAAPVIHEFIKSAADELGIEYEEGIEDKKGKAKQDERRAMQMSKKLGGMPKEEEPKGLMPKPKRDK